MYEGGKFFLICFPRHPYFKCDDYQNGNSDDEVLVIYFFLKYFQKVNHFRFFNELKFKL